MEWIKEHQILSGLAGAILAAIVAVLGMFVYKRSKTNKAKVRGNNNVTRQSISGKAGANDADVDGDDNKTPQTIK